MVSSDTRNPFPNWHRNGHYYFVLTGNMVGNILHAMKGYAPTDALGYFIAVLATFLLHDSGALGVDFL